MADKRFEGIPELIGLVIFIATGATLSMLYERGCQDTNTLTITAHQAGEVWLSVIANRDEMGRMGEVKAGEPTAFDAPVGGVRVELRRGEEVLHTSFIQVLKKTPVAVVLGGGTFTDARDGEVYPYVHAGGLRWMGQTLRYMQADSRCMGGSERCDERLYRWEQALTACPAGWRVPNNRDWQQLAQQFGGCDSCPDLKGAASGSADRMTRGDEFGLKLGFNRYWSSSTVAGREPVEAFVMGFTYKPGGEWERSMTDSERRDAEWRERQRPEPSTLNERRKRDARLNAKVRDTYSSSVSSALSPLSSYGEASLRCVSD